MIVQSASVAGSAPPKIVALLLDTVQFSRVKVSWLLIFRHQYSLCFL